jgi:chaperonin cofactor prefoldin
MTTVNEVDARVTAHIDVCAVRYQSIEDQMRAVNARLKRLEQILISCAGAIMLLLVGIVLKVH